MFYKLINAAASMLNALRDGRLSLRSRPEPDPASEAQDDFHGAMQRHIAMTQRQRQGQ